MKTLEIQASLRTYAARCEGIAARRMAEGDKLLAADFLLEAIAAIEISKMIVLMPLEMVPSFLRSLSPNSPTARVARRKALRAPRPRRASAQHLLRFAQSVTARLRAEQLTQTTR